MRVFLWVLKEARCKDVPSFDELRRVQKQLRTQCGTPSIPCKSPLGNIFFMNDPRAIIAKDWENPTTRKLIHVYPEIPEDGVIREIWHAAKWRKTMDLDILSPMYDAGVTHYYVNEVARLRDGKFVIPIRWVKFRGRIYADAFSVTFDDQVCQSFNSDCFFLKSSTIDAGHIARMPNLKRKIAAGRPMYSSFVNYFADDVSGNRSKSWNKHWNAYMTHQNLPRKVLQQEFHVHFVSTSPNASVSEQFLEFKAAVEETHADPVEVRDESGNATCFCIYCNAGPSDNPMQSEISAHIGGKGNCFCRKCQVGGTQADKATNEGYHALTAFRPPHRHRLAGVPRTKEQIIQELEKQVKLACSGVIKPVKDLQTKTGVKDVYTQFWIDGIIARFKEMRKDEPNHSVEEIQEELVQWTVENRDNIYSFDPTKDTPIEILHTILLGIIKYIWHITHTPWSAEQKQMYAHRLQSTSTDGLSIHPIRSAYIMQYAGSLIGRQLKTLAQTNVFHVRGLVTDDQFTAWKAAGELAALLWFPEIRNLAEYRRDLQVAVANVLDIFATIDPSKIITKIKYHLLVHTDDDVVEFGPLIGLATEIFESFNGVFRYCSILSNHLAPSRDIARQLADQEDLKHRLAGGWWPCGEDGKWERAGTGVRHFMAEHPILQKLLGWTEPSSMKHESMWNKCTYVISESLDECLVGSWDSSTIAGRISDILVDSASLVLVVLERFQVLSARDKTFGMPVLTRRDSESSQSIKFKFNVQHDSLLDMQERVESDQIENYIVHGSLDRFFINMHSFHNAHLLRATLPRDLVAPIPLFSDRQAKHVELATQLREKVAIRKAAAANKRKRPSDDEGDDEVDARPRKARKKTPKKRKQNLVVLPPTGSMVANRPRRTILPTEKAKAAQQVEQPEEEEAVDCSDDSDDGYIDSDEDYSE
ncbi:hypothetical protein DFH08DRAFT_927472 [Mycena albidolilacea]|uniref:Uncharacterized protein n=1 Tax=Mycena albidolilacea TaxID=1033008 RepID=A0AAD6Z550_9AGAR|nr:hypothetical protein DFH08DRAFT_927472 [Mycena albidolilacea]